MVSISLTNSSLPDEKTEREQQTFQTQTNTVQHHLKEELYSVGAITADERQYGEVERSGIEPQHTALAMAVVKLYCGVNGKFKNANLGGIFCFIIDRELHSRFLRLYDVNSKVLLFQTELFINFNEAFKALGERFHCFQLKKAVIGVEYASSLDAKLFDKLIQKFSITSPLTDTRTMDKFAKEERKKMIGNSLITKPTQMNLTQHAGWDPHTQTFDHKRMPKQVQQLLKKSGIKRKQLGQKDVAIKIYEQLLEQIDFEQFGGIKKNVQADQPESLNTSSVDGFYRTESHGDRNYSFNNRLKPGIEKRLEKNTSSDSLHNNRAGSGQPVTGGRGPPSAGGLRAPRPRAPGTMEKKGTNTPMPNNQSTVKGPPASLAQQLQGVQLKKATVRPRPQVKINAAKQVQMTAQLSQLANQIAERGKALGNLKNSDDESDEGSEGSWGSDSD